MMSVHTAPCEDRVTCEPPIWPTSLSETWTCPDCGQEYKAFDPNTDPLSRVPAGRTAGLGWASAARPTSTRSGKRLIRLGNARLSWYPARGRKCQVRINSLDGYLEVAVGPLHFHCGPGMAPV